MSGSEPTTTRGVVLAIALPAVLLGGLLIVALRARHSLQRAPEFTVDPARWQVMGRPAWMGEELAAGLTAGVSAHIAGAASLLREEELDWLKATIAQSSPWIEAVEIVEPKWPAQAEISVRLHKPVLVQEGGLLVAADGRELGWGAVALSPAPLAAPAQGKLTEEQRIECAAAAAQFLPWRAEFEKQGVRLAGVAPGKDDAVEFTTDAGVVLSWGRSSRRSPLAYLDLPLPARLDNLREVLRDFPGLVGVGSAQLWTDRPVVIRRDG